MISEKQLQIMAFPYSTYDYLICDGSIRSGKTSIGFLTYIDDAMRRYNNHQFIIIGNTIRTVLRNVIEPYMTMSYARKKYALDWNGGASCLTVKRGNVSNEFFVFGANNDRSYEPIQGMTAAGLFVDEAALCNEKAFNTALGRLSVSGAKSFFNCNPSYPLHWFNQKWILDAKEMNALYLSFTMDDNPSLDESTKRRLKRQYKGVFYDRYIRGLWVVAEGLVYQFDSPADYTCTHDEALEPRKDNKGNVKPGRGIYYLSIDYGITNPFACLLWRVTADRAYIVDEYYFASNEQGRRRTDAEHYEAVEKFARGYNIEYMIVDPSASSFKEEVERHGKFDVMDADNEVIAGIQVTDQMLHDGSVKISETCTNTLKEIQMYRWDDSKAKDEVIKESDHAMDAMRYQCNTVLKYELKGYA